jgi:hypothetical protein
MLLCCITSVSSSTSRSSLWNIVLHMLTASSSLEVPPVYSPVPVVAKNNFQLNRQRFICSSCSRSAWRPAITTSSSIGFIPGPVSLDLVQQLKWRPSTIVSHLGRSKHCHICIYCGKIYSRKYGLTIHIRPHDPHPDTHRPCTSRSSAQYVPGRSETQVISTNTSGCTPNTTTRWG